MLFSEMTKTSAIFIVLALLTSFAPTNATSLAQSTTPLGTEVVVSVSPQGNDSASGDADAPIKTFDETQKRISKFLASQNPPDTISIRLASGEYRVTSPLTFEFGRSAKSPSKIELIGDVIHPPVISGGYCVSDWTVTKDGLWKATVPRSLIARHLFSAGIPLPWAGTEALSGVKLTWKTFPLNPGEIGEISVDSIDTQPAPSDNDLQLLWIDDFRAHWIPVKFRSAGNKWTLIPAAASTRIAIDNNLKKAGRFSANSRIENALSLIRAGEWFFSRADSSLFYSPKVGQKIKEFIPEIPVAPSLLTIRGASKVAIRVRGIQWRLAAWDDPTQDSFVSNQSGVGWINSNVGSGNYDLAHSSKFLKTIPAAIRIENSTNVRFEANLIACTGGAGLSVSPGCANISITENTFSQIGADALTIGAPIHPENDPLCPPCREITVSRNWITHTGHTFPSAAAITAFYLNNSLIEKNTLENLPYTGISVGWGWNHRPDYQGAGRNRILCNRISDYMLTSRDGGAIYTLGPQPGSVCRGNYLLGGSNKGVFGAIYHDIGSSGWVTTGNVIEKSYSWLDLHLSKNIFVTRNYSDQPRWVDHGIDCKVEDNLLKPRSTWPQIALDIINAAGRAGKQGLSSSSESSQK